MPLEIDSWWEGAQPLLAQVAVVGGESFSIWVNIVLPILEVLSVLVTLALAVGIIYVIIKSQMIPQKAQMYADLISFSNLDEKRIIKAWRQIEMRIVHQQEADLKLAVIEADKLLDEVLKVAGYQGETMADRMKNLTPANLSNIEQAWRAHKVRNRIVHEPDFEITTQEALELVDIYRKALQEFGLIR